ncbi:MAG TPA: hypothetical protein VI775_01970 [Candidatus Paceibacterota bacterium]
MEFNKNIDPIDSEPYNPANLMNYVKSEEDVEMTQKIHQLKMDDQLNRAHIKGSRMASKINSRPRPKLTESDKDLVEDIFKLDAHKKYTPDDLRGLDSFDLIAIKRDLIIERETETQIVIDNVPFICDNLIALAPIIEKLSTAYIADVTGYATIIQSNRAAILNCLEQMARIGELNVLHKFLSPKYQFFVLMTMPYIQAFMANQHELLKRISASQIQTQMINNAIATNEIHIPNINTIINTEQPDVKKNPTSLSDGPNPLLAKLQEDPISEPEFNPIMLGLESLGTSGSITN